MHRKNMSRFRALLIYEALFMTLMTDAVINRIHFENFPVAFFGPERKT